MTTNYNPDIVTHNESPTPEAVKAAAMVSRYCYWMTNQSSKQRLIDCFGNVLGEHFWTKLVNKRNSEGTLAGDLGFWFELSIGNREKLMHYILRTKYRCQ